MTKTGLSWGLVTDVGQVRSINEDSAMANGSLFAVADGMGGHRGGEVASGMATESLTETESIASIEELHDLVVAMNGLIRARGQDDAELMNMGTTVVAMGVLPVDQADDSLRFAAANVGDSRIYLLEQGELSQLSTDHSLVGELTRSGQITEEEAAQHPQRNVVTRALGAENNVLVDTWEIPARLGQRYLLCSDGLVNEVSDGEIAQVLTEVHEPGAAAKALVDLANDYGGRDNITVLVLDIVETRHLPSDDSSCGPDETKS